MYVLDHVAKDGKSEFIFDKCPLMAGLKFPYSM